MKSFVQVLMLCAMAIAGPVMAAENAGDMDEMAATMQRIRATEDPAERERLLEQHLDQMHAEMAMMHRRMGNMIEQMEAQQRETKRLHDHRKSKNR